MKTSLTLFVVCSQHLWYFALSSCCKFFSCLAKTFHLIFVNYPCTRMVRRLSATWNKICWALHHMIYGCFKIYWLDLCQTYQTESPHLNVSVFSFAVTYSRSDLQSLHLGRRLSATTMVIILREFVMFDQIFLSSQVKWSLIISNKLVYTTCLTSCRTT